MLLVNQAMRCSAGLREGRLHYVAGAVYHERAFAGSASRERPQQGKAPAPLPEREAGRLPPEAGSR